MAVVSLGLLRGTVLSSGSGRTFLPWSKVTAVPAGLVQRDQMLTTHPPLQKVQGFWGQRRREGLVVGLQVRHHLENWRGQTDTVAPNRRRTGPQKMYQWTKKKEVH